MNVVLPVQQLREREAAIYEHTTKTIKMSTLIAKKRRRLKKQIKPVRSLASLSLDLRPSQKSTTWEASAAPLLISGGIWLTTSESHKISE